jgi:hypothetical protein
VWLFIPNIKMWVLKTQQVEMPNLETFKTGAFP